MTHGKLKTLKLRKVRPINIIEYESKITPELYFYAKLTADNAGRPAWMIVSQLHGGPEIEAFDAWFDNLKDADKVARQLANGEI
jgi:hypothetical protein